MDFEILFKFMQEYGINGVAAVALLLIAYTQMLNARNADRADQRESQEEQVKNQTLLELAKVIGTAQASTTELTNAVQGVVTSSQKASEQQTTEHERLMKLSDQTNIKLDTLTGVFETAQQTSKQTNEKLMPKLDTLTQQLIQTENRVDSNMESQAVTNKQILEALLRIEKSVQEIKRINEENAERIEKTENDLKVVRDDIRKKITSTTPTIKPDPAPDNQPIVKANPETSTTPVILNKTEPKTETKKEETNESS